jgi:hypothetical protein
MAHINWDQPFYVDPATLLPAASGIPLPTYGNFGGAGYSQGVFIANPDLAQFDPVPVDALDQEFLFHDQASALADTTAEQAAADAALIRGIEVVDQGQLDAEASLYAGGATLAMIEQLAAADSLGLLSQGELAQASGNALENIGSGLSGLSTAEAMQAAAWLNDVAQATGVDLSEVVGDVYAIQAQQAADFIFL